MDTNRFPGSEDSLWNQPDNNTSDPNTSGSNPQQEKLHTPPANNFSQSSNPLPNVGNPFPPYSQNETPIVPDPYNQNPTQTQFNSYQTPSFNEPLQPSSPKKSRKKLFLAIGVFALFLLLAGGSFAGATMIAYDKIPLQNKELKERVSNFVFSMPFIPKTAKYVLATSLKVQETVTSGYVDGSFAIKGVPLTEVFDAVGIASFPIEITFQGSFDYSDLENPLANVNVNFANQIELDSKTLDNKVYFRINKLPILLIGAMGVASPESFDVFLHKWVYVDTMQLNSEAREALLKKSDENLNDLAKRYSDFGEKLLEEDFLPYMSLEDEKINGKKLHKLSMDLTAEEFTELTKSVLTKSCLEFADDFKSSANTIKGTKDKCDFSDIEPPKNLQELTISAWIDQDTYYLVKLEGYTKFKVDDSSSAPTSLPGLISGDRSLEILGTLKLTKQNEKFDFTAPSDAIDFETFVKQAEDVINPTTTTEFAKTKSDVQLVRTSLELYLATNGQYPASLVELYNSDINTNLSTVVAESKIKYASGQSDKSVIVYSTIKDPRNSFQPYYAIVSTDESTKADNYSAEEINQVLAGMGLPADTTLTLTITPLLQNEPLMINDTSNFIF